MAIRDKIKKMKMFYIYFAVILKEIIGGMERFAIKAAPHWFEWLGWILLLGAQLYCFEKTHNVFVAITVCISMFLLFFYFQAFFYKLEFKDVPILCVLRYYRTASIIMSGITTFLMWQVAMLLAKLVSEYK